MSTATDAPAVADGGVHDQPRIYERGEHSLSRRQVSECALKVLYRLHKAGYKACLVGGGVRDILLGLEPKDFDIATDAHPDEVRELFRNCRLIGRRFRLAHVRFGPEVIEVATFRGAQDDNARLESDEGRILQDNVYGDIHEDVWRRDFTVNALYYDISDFSVIDYVDGMEDLRARVLRLIGDPEQRYREDPVRMLRAVRLAEKLGFEIDPAAAAPMPALSHLLGHIAPARLFDEALKLFQAGAAVKTFRGLRRHGLFRELFPETDRILDGEAGAEATALIERALENTDRRVAEGLPITPAFLFAALLWPAFKESLAAHVAEGMKAREAHDVCGEVVVANAVTRVALPRRFSYATREIWSLQYRLEHRQRKRVLKLMEQKRFRAAYDFLLMRAEAGEVDPALASWWSEIQEATDETRASMLKSLTGEAPPGAEGAPKKRRRRRRRR